MDAPALARLIEDACLAEALAPKPGNVHPGASFDDLTFDSFRQAAYLSSAPLSRSDGGVGRAIYEAVERVRDATGTNVNLGIALLIAPLAAVRQADWPSVVRVMDDLTLEDARDVYRTIRLANPGGLGEAPEADVRSPPRIGLRESMQLARDRDSIARIIAEAYSPLFDEAVPRLREQLEQHAPGDAIVRFAVEWHAHWPDTHIARRCGTAVAEEASRRASKVVVDWAQLSKFDRWLRSDGHRRNPGTTADITAATLFALMRTDTDVGTAVTRWVDKAGVRWPR